jgi:hypothetical protein
VPEKRAHAQQKIPTVRGTYETVVLNADADSGTVEEETTEPEPEDTVTAKLTSKTFHSHPDDPDYQKPFEDHQSHADRLCHQVRRLTRPQLKQLEAFLKELQPGPTIEGRTGRVTYEG